MTAINRNPVSVCRDLDVSRNSIRHLSRKNWIVSAAKICVYFGGAALFAIAYLFVDISVIKALAILGLGVLFAHGVELQHEALHGNLFPSPTMNAVAGRVLGAPMLVSFTQYRAFHFYHHRHVGTDRDEELFDYSISSLGNPVSFTVRAWNLLRIPQFVVTFLRMLQNEYPAKIKASDRRAVLVEHAALLGLLASAVASVFLLKSDLALMLWIVPWLLVAEPLHFMIEVPEHLGCDRSTPTILRNTRSYPTNPVWGISRTGTTSISSTTCSRPCRHTASGCSTPGFARRAAIAATGIGRAGGKSRPRRARASPGSIMRVSQIA